MTQEEYNVWACTIPGIGNETIKKIGTVVENGEDLYFNTKEVLKVPGITGEQYETIEHSKKKFQPEKWEERLLQTGVMHCTFFSPEYPDSLRYILNPPRILYYKGRLPDPTHKKMAVIGARDCSPYGRQMAWKMAKEAALLGVEVISGLARGIDSYGHRGALDAGGITHGILGNGPDVIYPKENKDIYGEILKKGSVISEYYPGTPSLAKHFPMRNRMISGLSDLILVVEAKKKSGSLITVSYALEQGKEVAAIPGRIQDLLSGGCNELIRQGATMISDEKDLFDALGMSFKKRVKIRKETLTPEERNVFENLGTEMVNVTALKERLDPSLPMSHLMKILVSLEKKEMIQEVGRGYYRKICESSHSL